MEEPMKYQIEQLIQQLTSEMVSHGQLATLYDKRGFSLTAKVEASLMTKCGQIIDKLKLILNEKTD